MCGSACEVDEFVHFASYCSRVDEMPIRVARGALKLPGPLSVALCGPILSRRYNYHITRIWVHASSARTDRLFVERLNYVARTGRKTHKPILILSPELSPQALCGVVFEVPTMNGEKLRISTMHEIIKPNTVKRITGYGLPFPKDTTRKGDMLVAFDIKFPEKLSASEKELLSDILVA